MQYNVMGNSGITVSRVCLGTMTFGDQADEATSQKMMDMAVDAGVNFIDTADAYVKGESEAIVGRWLKGKRDRIVLASKVCNVVGEDKIKDGGLHRWHVIKGVEDSLRRLQTDCLDIFYLHRPDGKTPIEETMAAFDTLVQQGKVMYVGMSNFASWQMTEALWKCEKHSWSPPVVSQVPYNIITRSIDEEFVAFSKRFNIGMTTYNPLAAGLLTGKHKKDAGPEKGTRFERNKEYFGRFWSDRNFEALEVISKISSDAGIPLTELALRWVLTNKFVSSVILGASKLAHLEENIRCCNEDPLPGDVMKALDEVWAGIRGSHFRYNR